MSIFNYKCVSILRVLMDEKERRKLFFFAIGCSAGIGSLVRGRAWRSAVRNVSNWRQIFFTTSTESMFTASSTCLAVNVSFCIGYRMKHDLLFLRLWLSNFFWNAIGCSAGGSLVRGRAWDSVWGICAQLRTFSITLAESINWYAVRLANPTFLAVFLKRPMGFAVLTMINHDKQIAGRNSRHPRPSLSPSSLWYNSNRQYRFSGMAW